MPEEYEVQEPVKLTGKEAYNAAIEAVHNGQVAWRKAWQAGSFIRKNEEGIIEYQDYTLYTGTGGDQTSTDWFVGDCRVEEEND